MSYAIVNLEREVSFAKVLDENFGITSSCLFVDGVMCGDVEAVVQKYVLPVKYVKESLDQKLVRLVN